MMNNRGFTLIHIVVATLIFAVSIIPIANMFSQSTATVGKSKYLFMASSVAVGELERFRTGKFSDIRDFEHDWIPIEDCDDDIINTHFGGYPEEILDFEKKIVTERLSDDLVKVTVKIRWRENLQGQELIRQLNYPLIMARRWRFE